MGSTDPWCHCCTPATEDRSTRKPLGTDSSAQDNQRRRRGERAPEKSKLEWKAGGRDNREVLQGWWEMWLGDELREGRLQQQRLRQGQEMVPEPRGHAQPTPAGQEEGHGSRRIAVPSSPWPAWLQPSPAHLTVLAPGWPPSALAAAGEDGPLRCPPASGAGSSHAPACRSPWTPVGRSPAFRSKRPVLEPAAAAQSPPTSGVLIHSSTWHFNP